jgi:hypothetical protein
MSSDLLFSSIGIPYFARYLATIAGGTYVKHGDSVRHEGNLFLVGYQQPRRAFYLKLWAEKIAIMFAGKDLRLLLRMKPDSREELMSSVSRHGHVTWVSESPSIQSMIKNRTGIDTTVVYLPSRHNFPDETPPMPKKFTVGCYIPYYRGEYYNRSLLLPVAKAMPDVNFHVYSLKGFKPSTAERRLRNIITYKQKTRDMPGLVARCSCGLRVTKFDTYSMTAIEFLMSGRWFINNHPMPYAKKIRHDPSVEEIVKAIRAFQRKRGYNQEAVPVYRANHSKEAFRDRVQELFEGSSDGTV